MLIAALIGGFAGWRGIWRVTALCNLAYAGVVWVMYRKHVASAIVGAIHPPPFKELFATALRSGPLLLAGCFLTYAANFIALTGFLPLMLQETGQAASGAAGLLAAFVVAANMLGNAASGFIAERGLKRSRIIAVASAITGLCGIGVFVEILPFPLRYGLALLFAAVGGIIPGSCFGAAQSLAASPAKASPIFGGLIQGAGIGQLVGPPIVAAIVKAMGSWHGAAVFIAAAALITVALALTFERIVPVPEAPGGSSPRLRGEQ
jgi:MFS family permease